MPQAIRTGSHNTNNGINTINRRQEEFGAQKKKTKNLTQTSSDFNDALQLQKFELCMFEVD